MKRLNASVIAAAILFSAMCLTAAATDVKTEAQTNIQTSGKAEHSQPVKTGGKPAEKSETKTATESSSKIDTKITEKADLSTTSKQNKKTESAVIEKQEVKEISFAVPAPERENSILQHKNALKYANEKLAASVKNMPEKYWYPVYHAAPPANWMSSPSGFSYFNKEYHLFYQHNPFAPQYGKMYWGHMSSSDMINWKNLPVALAPTDNYDKNGVLSGTSIVKDGLLYLLYSGSHNMNGNKSQMVNLAMSKDGLNFVKSANNPVVLKPPAIRGLKISNEHFRDPFVWKHGDTFYSLIGTQNIPTKDGMVLIYKSSDLTNWKFNGITALGNKSEIGYMWESPALVRVDNMDVLAISPQGIKPNGKNFLNKHQSGWFVGNLDYNTGKFKQVGAFGVFDKGFDFYAPQFIKTEDGRVVMIGWLGMADSAIPEKAEGWSGMMSIPRELKIINKKVYTLPVEEMKKLRAQTICLKDKIIESEKSFLQINGDSYELDIVADMSEAKSLGIELRASDTQKTILSYDKEKGALVLNRDKSGKDLTGEREAPLKLSNNLLKLRIFVDKSSVEVFANDGEIVMSSRIYPDRKSTGIKFIANGKVKLQSLNFYKLKPVAEK